jgi:hypothetical protein
MIRWLPLLLLLLLQPLLGAAQWLSGEVRDGSTGEAVGGAVVRVQGLRGRAVTDSLGRFRLDAGAETGYVEVNRVGYRQALLPYRTGQSLLVRLQASAALPDVLITAGPERVLKDKTLHLYDYDFLDDALVVILYDRAQRRPYLALLDARDEVIDRLDLPEKPSRLQRDCMGKLHAITAHYACQLFRDGDRLAYLSDTLPLFEEFVAPCLGSLDDYYYFRHERANGQVVDYYHFNAATQQGQGFLQLVDKQKIYQMLDPFEPYVQFASNKAELLALTPEQWDKINKLDYEMQFNRMAFFYSIHAPLHVLGEQVLVFDHTNRLLRKLDASGRPVDSVAITYPKMKGWQKVIYTDPIQGRAYTATEKMGYLTLHEIDLHTGALLGDYPVPFQFTYKIQIVDGVAYFLYRSQEALDDTKRLYRMGLQ